MMTATALLELRQTRPGAASASAHRCDKMKGHGLVERDGKR